MDEVAARIIAADERCRSWREKLDFVRELLTGNEPLTAGEFADIAIYLRFLGTGQVPCAEDGRHYRPAHHARIASEIQKRLAQSTMPDTAWIAREIYPSLPSSARPFQRAEPLTRIRDIAHRNDIPSELKKEIKTTLQNKLHRCAGPEDLSTSQALLERITAPDANYPPPFVEQFRIFHEELKEFFNARSLDEQLEALKSRLGDGDAGLIRGFLAAKPGKNLQEQTATFRILTELRTKFCARAAADADESQEFLLADIALEDFAFALMSELLNALEAMESEANWDQLFELLLLAIANLILSGVEADECRAIDSELHAWRTDFDPSDREQFLRLKATVDRARRVAEDFSDRITALFPPRVKRLGNALGVDERAIRVFCDAEIRGHLVFQFSKLVADISRRLRESLQLPAWEVIVSGHAVGRLLAASSLEELAQDSPKPSLVLLQAAEGDEEIPKGVAGIVLAHRLPHLSHLGVRARQAGVVLVACEDPVRFEELHGLRDRRLNLIATEDRFELASGVEATLSRPRVEIGRAEVPEVKLTPRRACLSLDAISPESGGGKADGARRLAELAARDDAGFKTPPAVVIPFGVMEAALRESPNLESEVRSSIQQINQLPRAEFDATVEHLREMIQRLPAPDEIKSVVEERFGPQARLIVRSSANCEDLEQLAGAGLYESMANISMPDLASAVRAVWASLWTRRAALSRKQAGIPHDRVHMAVLVQQMLAPDLSFVVHTNNPISHNPDEVYVELAVGLGETLASAAIPGNPYRLACDKTSRQVKTLALASFSLALWPHEAGGIVRRRVDYSQVPVSREPEARRELGAKLAAVAQFVEKAFGKPQDIEGAVLDSEIFLVQSRAQQGLKSEQTG